MIIGNNINYLTKIIFSDYSLPASYTYKKNLSSKIYSTISKTGLNKNILIELINKSKKLKNIIDKYKFSQTNSSINLIEISDPSKLEATLKDNSANNNVNYIKINKLASTQEVKSINLRPDSETILDNGIYKFVINIDNTDIEVDISVSHLDIPKNKDLLNTLAYLINRMNIGLKAEVCTRKKRSVNSIDPDFLIKYIYLKITNVETGNNHYFELQDIDNNLVSTLKLNKIQKSSQNSEYFFNTVKGSNSSNEVIEDEGKLLLKFLEPTNDVVILKSKKINDLKDYVIKVIEEFNEYINWIYKKQNLFSKRLIFDIKDIFSKHYKNLKQMDFTLDQNDKILVGNYFQDIINTNPAKYINYLFGESGFFTDVKNLLNKIINSPRDYQLTDDKLSLYSRYGDKYVFNPPNNINSIQLKV